MAMLDGLRVVFLEALSFADEMVRKKLVTQWNEQCEEVYKYKQALVAEEQEKRKSEVEKLHEVIFKKEDLMQEIAKERNKYSDEVEELKGELAIAKRHEKDARSLFKDAVIQLQNARAEVAREIFEEFEKKAYLQQGDWHLHFKKYDDLKKKYTEGDGK